jgi:hypothetical protein
VLSGGFQARVGLPRRKTAFRSVTCPTFTTPSRVADAERFLLAAAWETWYQSLLDSGKFESRAALARYLGVSRARVAQVLDRLKGPGLAEA